MKWYWWIVLAIMVGYAAQGCTNIDCVDPVTDMDITLCTGDINPADPLEDETMYMYTEEEKAI